MRFHLSTLLIIVTGLAGLLSQCGAPERFVILALIELFFLVAWIGVKQGSFPWKAIIAFAIAIDATGAGIAFAYKMHASWESAFGAAAFVAFFGGLLLAMVIGLYHAFYLIVEALFRANRPKFGPPPSNLPDDPFAGWSGRDQGQ